MKLSVLIPVYNERRTLREIVQRVLNQDVPGINEKEIIIIDDYSTDGSREIVRQLHEENPVFIRPIYLEENQGKGNAIRLAIQAASGDIAIIQDADLEYNPTDYDIVLRPIIKAPPMLSTVHALPNASSAVFFISGTPLLIAF